MAETSRSKLGKVYPKTEVEKAQTAYLKELRTMISKTRCADCGGRNANWVSLKRPAFVCIDCAQKLRADASNKVKNCMGSYLWHEDEMLLMRTLK